MEQSSKNKNRIIENETWNGFMNEMVIEEEMREPKFENFLNL
jgi:hypothetical protein